MSMGDDDIPSDLIEFKKWCPYFRVPRDWKGINIPKIQVFNGRNYYVTSNGTGNGSFESPMQFQQALTAAKSGDKIFLKQGDVFRGPFVSNTQKIWISSYNTTDDIDQSVLTNQPAITSGIRIDDILIPENVTLANRMKVIKYDLSSIMKKIKSQTLRHVWLNGFRLVLARYPNLYNNYYRNGNDTADLIKKFSIKDTNTIEFVVYDLETPPVHWKESTLRISDKYSPLSYTIDNVLPTSFKRQNSTWFTLKTRESISIRNAKRFYVENSKMDLDGPGEFYYDPIKFELFMIPCPEELCQQYDVWYQKGIWILPTPLSFDSTDSSKDEILFQPAALEINGADTRIQVISFSTIISALRVNAPRFDLHMSNISNLAGTGIVLTKNAARSSITKLKMRDAVNPAIYCVADDLYVGCNNLLNIGNDMSLSSDLPAITCGRSCVIEASIIRKVGDSIASMGANSTMNYNQFYSWSEKNINRTALLAETPNSLTMVNNDFYVLEKSRRPTISVENNTIQDIIDNSVNGTIYKTDGLTYLDIVSTF